MLNQTENEKKLQCDSVKHFLSLTFFINVPRRVLTTWKLLKCLTDMVSFHRYPFKFENLNFLHDFENYQFKMGCTILNADWYKQMCDLYNQAA